MTDETGQSTSDSDHEEYWIRRPSIPDQREVYIRIVGRERAEIIGEGDDEPKEISLYEVWQTDRQTGLSPTFKSHTPWGERDV